MAVTCSVIVLVATTLLQCSWHNQVQAASVSDSGGSAPVKQIDRDNVNNDVIARLSLQLEQLRVAQLNSERNFNRWSNDQQTATDKTLEQLKRHEMSQTSMELILEEQQAALSIQQATISSLTNECNELKSRLGSSNRESTSEDEDIESSRLEELRILNQFAASDSSVTTEAYVEESSSENETPDADVEEEAAQPRQLAAIGLPASTPAGASGYRPTSGGVTYIRWGRTECTVGASILYEGVAGTGKYNEGGDGSNMICLHRNPVWKETISNSGGRKSLLYSVEYKFYNLPFSTSNNGGHSLESNDMPCVACHVRTRTAQIMIPARDTCPYGWTREYWGYLVAAHAHHHQRGEYNCLDDAPEVSAGGSAASGGAEVFAVETPCGYGFLCPPFKSGYGVLCVVCSL